MDRIRWRIALPYIVLILALLAGLGIFLSNTFQQATIQQLQDRLTNDARSIARATLPHWGQPALLEADAREWADLMGARVTIIDPQGTVLAESDDTPTRMDNHLDRPEVAAALAGQTSHSVRYSNTVGYDMLYTALPLQEADGPILGVVRVALPLDEVGRDLARLQSALFGAALLASLVAIVLALLIANNTSRPLEQLTSAANRMARGETANEPLPSSIREVSLLVQAFNSMAVRIRQQMQTQETESARLAAVLNNMADGVLIVDAAGLVRLINPAAANLLECAGDCAGHPLAEVCRPYQPLELWRAALASQTSHSQAFAWRKLALLASAIPLSRSLPGHTLLLLQDETKRQQVESMRRDFISNVSHELRTPLAALKVMVETLQDGALGDPTAAARFLGNMEGEIDSLNLMVAELLELSKVESGQVPLERLWVVPEALLAPARDRLRLQAERAGLDLRMELPAEAELPQVYADPNRVQQVLTNLLHNAIKFTPAGGSVVCGAQTQNGEVCFYVRDTGIGIDPQNQQRVFERFFKEDKARSGGGTGLGLSICRHIVAMHGGRIWLQSALGQGSTFWFTLA